MHIQGVARYSEGSSSPEPTNHSGNLSRDAVKKRPSRAGTRSVSTLSTAQLERKRANDREAQRAIRQRTKNTITKLERRIQELESANEFSEHLMLARNRNRELEEENALLKLKLDQLAVTYGIPDGSAIQGWNSLTASRSTFHPEPMHMVNNLHIPHSPMTIGGEPLRQDLQLRPEGHWHGTNPYSPAASTGGQTPTSSNADQSSEYASWTLEGRAIAPCCQAAMLQSNNHRSHGLTSSDVQSLQCQSLQPCYEVHRIMKPDSQTILPLSPVSQSSTKNSFAGPNSSDNPFASQTALRNFPMVPSQPHNTTNYIRQQQQQQQHQQQHHQPQQYQQSHPSQSQQLLIRADQAPSRNIQDSQQSFYCPMPEGLKLSSSF